jgi:ferredoxin
MKINEEKCIGCDLCIPYCCGGAISQTEDGEKCVVDEDKCVECYVCKWSECCPKDAFEETPLEWPRSLRHTFSAVKAAFSDTRMDGRGTKEMKTNDITGRFRQGEVGFTVDVGRPGITTSFADVEKIAMAVAEAGVTFVEDNPTTRLMEDGKSGKFRADVKGERVLSCILEFKIEEEHLMKVIEALRAVAEEVDTVFSVGCISRCRKDGSIPVKALLDKAGVFYRPNGKVNAGMGRPLSPF